MGGSFLGQILGALLVLDPAASTLSFTLDATLHTVHGTLALSEGRISFDPSSGEASGRAVVDARSASTDNAKRDRKMHDEVLESARFPEIVFTAERLSGKLERAGESQMTLAGTIEIHGTKQQIEVPAKVHVEGEKLTATAGFAVPYVAWGMKDPSAFLLRVGKTVQVTLELSGTLAP